MRASGILCADRSLMARYDFDYELTLGCVHRGRNDFTAQDQPILAFSTVRSHDVTQCDTVCYYCDDHRDSMLCVCT